MADNSTTKIDLPFDVNINGVQYFAGKDVEVQSKHTDAIDDIVADRQTANDFQSTHHGAVPAPNDPQEATAQTPTRPLGGEHVRQPVTVVPSVNNGDVQKVEDPNAGNEAATKAKTETVSASNADVVETPTTQAPASSNSTTSDQSK